ncbi:DNA-processing protein DprA [Nesterenkonia halotolerans]|uniref:DNA-processing protein DprA n=1 Tax=Nesterenkonia halotolerans TaxID=225325 RepID=UPI003EE72895
MDIALERAALIGLLTRTAGMKWAEHRNRIAEGSTPADLATEYDIERGESTLERWTSTLPGASLFTYLDSGYPQQLLNVWDYPPFVFLQGDQTPLTTTRGDLGVSIVGTRNPTPDAIRDARFLARAIGEGRLTVISGLAAGIDFAAQSEALAFGYRTVGIIGTGIDRAYPATSKSLQLAIAKGAGMVLSQFQPGATPSKISFPMRNGVMSAYGLATIIVQASEKSGTKHQATQAVKHGRPLILLKGVVEGTTWGRRLADDPLIDAHAAETPSEAVKIVQRIMNRAAPAALPIPAS